MTKRKRGAQPGNTNALKHGLYAQHFTKAQRLKLKRMPAADLTFEIAALRTVAEEILAALKQNNADPDVLAKLANSLTNAMTTIAHLSRTHALLSGGDNALAAAIEEALNDFDPYQPPEDSIPLR